MNRVFDRVEPIENLVDLLFEPDDELAEPADVFAGRDVHRLEIRSHVVANRLLGGEHGLEQLPARFAELRAAHRLLEGGAPGALIRVVELAPDLERIGCRARLVLGGHGRDSFSPDPRSERSSG
jgi:hypothetical protein